MRTYKLYFEGSLEVNADSEDKAKEWFNNYLQTFGFEDLVDFSIDIHVTKVKEKEDADKEM